MYEVIEHENPGSQMTTLEKEKMAELVPAIDALNDQPLSLVLSTIGSRQRNRRLFTTANDRMGLACGSISPGDLLCVFHGSEVLHIIRKTSQGSDPETYKLIGDALVHGLMQGEVDSLGIESEEVILV